MTVLDEIIAGVVEDLAERQSVLPLSTVMENADRMPPARDPLPSLRAAGLSVIAEVKRSSPSKGDLADIADPAALARHYEAGGAAVISVLTEARRFRGSLADLQAVRAAVDSPLLRKDFVVTDYQIWEARAVGADVVLLIVAALADVELAALLALCAKVGLTALVEAHTPDEVRRAVDAGAALIGVNNRDLKTLDVDLSHFEQMANLIEPGIVKVAESGILSVADAARMRSCGADAILVGELLVRHGDPAHAVAELRSLA
ncbi:MAG TPA: indole-3-glycerol phosphate synthase TrpC [Propionibacteriaceae bacterium]|nr:indole-3-glycerol phosphate synthase TrpC [Propionibacteriaceae bacterium]